MENRDVKLIEKSLNIHRSLCNLTKDQATAEVNGNTLGQILGFDFGLLAFHDIGIKKERMGLTREI